MDLWLGSLVLLLIQFGQHGRGPMLATLLAAILLIFLSYKAEKKALLRITASLAIAVVIFRYPVVMALKKDLLWSGPKLTCLSRKIRYEPGVSACHMGCWSAWHIGASVLWPRDRGTGKLFCKDSRDV